MNKRKYKAFTSKTSHCIIEINAKLYSVLTHYICNSDDYMTLMHELIF